MEMWKLKISKNCKRNKSFNIKTINSITASMDLVEEIIKDLIEIIEVEIEEAQEIITEIIDKEVIVIINNISKEN